MAVDPLASLLTLKNLQGPSNWEAQVAPLKASKDAYGRMDYRPLQEFLASQDAANAEDPISQKYKQIAEQQAASTVYNQPEAKQMRDEQMANKLKLATAPAETAGKYQVQAAEAAGKERAILADENQAEQNARAAQNNENITNRERMTSQDVTNRQRVNGLQKGTIQAPGASGLRGLFGMGTSQNDANQAEINRLQAPQEAAAPDIVTLRGPDGSLRRVRADQAQKYIAAGAEVVQ